MPIISLKGVRGGVGSTTLSAALAWELHKLGDSVIIIDMSPDNLLRLHFNSNFSDASGWANAIFENKCWESTAWEYQDNLLFMPFGNLARKEKKTILESDNIFQFWSSNLDKLKDNSDYKWVIIDLPTNDGDLFTLLENYADIAINVAVPETNCHSRIFQNQSEYKNHILINKFDIRSELQSDIYQYWIHSLPNIIPVTIHHDEAMLEAAASKCPVGQYRPESLGASEAYALAIWCYTLLQPRDAL